MALLNWARSFINKNNYGAARLHSGDFNTLSTIAQEFDGDILQVRPYKNSEGIKRSEDLIAIFHDPSVQQSWLKDKLDLTSDPHQYAFEIWFSDQKLRFNIKTPNPEESRESQKAIGTLYPNANVQQSSRHMPKIPDGSYVAAGEFRLKHDKYAPLRSFDGPDAFEKDKIEEDEQVGTALVDPYRSIGNELIGHNSEAILFQITFEPAPDDWTDGYGLFDPSSERAAEYLREGRFVDSLFNPRIIDPTEKDLRTAEHISDLEGAQAFNCNIRYLVWAPDKRGAIKHVKGIENAFSTQYQNNKVTQQLEAIRYSGEEIKEAMFDAARRELTNKNVYLTKSELAALGHLPNDTINTSNVDFVKTVVGKKSPGESNNADKSSLRDKQHESESTNRYAEVEEHPPVAETEDGSGKSIVEKAKEIVDRGDKSFYRSSVDPDDYPETEITQQRDPQAAQKIRNFAAAYEENTLDLEKLRADADSEDEFEQFIELLEDHIEEAYIIRVKRQRAQQMEVDETTSSSASQPTVSASATDHTTSTADSKKLPITPSKYAVNFEETEYRQTRSQEGELLDMNFIQHGDGGGVYMGEDTRELFVEDHTENPDNDIWLGYQESGENPLEEVGIPKQSWFQHASIFGTTGKGKSTLIKNMANQVARKGHGFVMIDPKGDMAQEMVKELPEDRLDDVISVDHIQNLTTSSSRC